MGSNYITQEDPEEVADKAQTRRFAHPSPCQRSAAAILLAPRCFSQLTIQNRDQLPQTQRLLPEGGSPVGSQRREEAREHQEESKEEFESDSSDGEGDTTQDPLNRTKAAM